MVEDHLAVGIHILNLPCEMNAFILTLSLLLDGLLQLLICSLDLIVNLCLVHFNIHAVNTKLGLQHRIFLQERLRGFGHSH